MNDPGRLFALNVLLQIADGVLTHHGLAVGLREGNPAIATLMTTLGVGAALLLVKALALSALLLVRHLCPSEHVGRALKLTAASVTAAAILPWSAAILSLRL